MAAIHMHGLGKVFADGTRALADVNLTVGDGEFLVLVGPSGCGKTTILRMIAGLEEVSEGMIRIGDRVVNNVEPKERDVAMVFQNYALYPHMSVAQNIGFGLKLRGVPKRELNRRVEEVAEILGIKELLGRRPKALSGGQRQRVAMGRAMVREPQAFLMDEPLSNLDAKLRVQMRTELSKLHKRLGTTTVFVTHDQVEAMTLGQRVAVLKPVTAERTNNVQQVGSPAELFHDPANLFVAGFIGSPAMNLVYGTIRSAPDGLEVEFADARVRLGTRTLERHPALASYAGARVVVGVRPEDLSAAAAPDAAVSNGSLMARVDVVELLGSEALLHFELPVAPVITPDVKELLADRGVDVSSLGTSTSLVARVSSELEPNAGDGLALVINPNKLFFFDESSGRRIGQ